MNTPRTVSQRPQGWDRRATQGQLLSRMSSKSSWLVCPLPKLRAAPHNLCCPSLMLHQPHQLFTQSDSNTTLHNAATAAGRTSCGKPDLLAAEFWLLGKNALVPVSVLSQTYWGRISKSLHHQACFSSYALSTLFPNTSTLYHAPVEDYPKPDSSSPRGTALQDFREASQHSHLQADESRQGKNNLKGLNLRIHRKSGKIIF